MKATCECGRVNCVFPNCEHWRCGDGRLFWSLTDAKAHAERVFAATGAVIAIEHHPDRWDQMADGVFFD
jgi:hypothetical protein